MSKPPAAEKTNRFDVVGFIMDYECGEVDDERLVEGFQKLIDSGVVWELQGAYGRVAARLINTGLCRLPAK